MNSFPGNERHLIVNADDFGQSRGINQGVAEAFEHGIVTSASLMVRWDGAVEAAHYSHDHPDLSVGLHVDLGEWVYRDGNWVQLYQVVTVKDERAVYEELWKQIDTFYGLIGKTPTHLDSHQHVHRSGSVQRIFADAAEKLGIPLRDVSPRVRYYGGFYGQTDKGDPLPDNITAGTLSRIVDELRPGFTELGCHPAKAIDMESMYLDERIEEFKVLSHSSLRSLLRHKGVSLCSFYDVPGA